MTTFSTSIRKVRGSNLRPHFACRIWHYFTTLFHPCKIVLCYYFKTDRLSTNCCFLKVSPA